MISSTQVGHFNPIILVICLTASDYSTKIKHPLFSKLCLLNRLRPSRYFPESNIRTPKQVFKILYKQTTSWASCLGPDVPGTFY